MVRNRCRESTSKGLTLVRSATRRGDRVLTSLFPRFGVRIDVLQRGCRLVCQTSIPEVDHMLVSGASCCSIAPLLSRPPRCNAALAACCSAPRALPTWYALHATATRSCNTTSSATSIPLAGHDSRATTGDRKEDGEHGPVPSASSLDRSRIGLCVASDLEAYALALKILDFLGVGA